MEERIFYIEENGMLVFTKKFLLDRGFCCNNGCRNCPYKKTKNEFIKTNVSDSESGEAKPNLRQGCPHSRIEDEDA
jgi:hypothetical protein